MLLKLLKMELNNRAQWKNAIKFPFSVTVSKFSFTFPVVAGKISLFLCCKVPDAVSVEDFESFEI